MRNLKSLRDKKEKKKRLPGETCALKMAPTKVRMFIFGALNWMDHCFDYWIGASFPADHHQSATNLFLPVALKCVCSHVKNDIIPSQVENVQIYWCPHLSLTSACTLAPSVTIAYQIYHIRLLHQISYTIPNKFRYLQQIQSYKKTKQEFMPSLFQFFS